MTKIGGRIKFISFIAKIKEQFNYTNSEQRTTNNEQLGSTQHNNIVNNIVTMESVQCASSTKQNKIEIHANKNEIITFKLIEVKQTSNVKRQLAVHIAHNKEMYFRCVIHIMKWERKQQGRKKKLPTLNGHRSVASQFTMFKVHSYFIFHLQMNRF